MAFLRNTNPPAAFGTDLVWDDTETVLEVEDATANQLLRINGSGFSEVLPGDKDYPGKSGRPRRVAIAE